MTEYAILYARPDGWWEAGRGWDDKDDAERDAAEHLPASKPWHKGKYWQVVPVEEVDGLLCDAAKEDRS